VKARKALPFVLAALGLLFVAVLAASPNQDATPFAPDSTSPTGTKALVQLLQSFGANLDVTTDQPPTSADIALALPNTVPEERGDALRAWVGQGHTLVVADPESPLSAPPATGVSVVTSPVLQGDCDVSALARVGALGVEDDNGSSPISGRLFPVPQGATACYTQKPFSFGPSNDDRREAVLVVEPMGRGQIVSLGVPSIWTNQGLGDQDNAALATALLAPRQGTQVAVLQLPSGTVAHTTLSSLISIGVKLAFLQLVLALIVYLFFRGRRLGKPIVEEQPVQIPGSELVSAVGNLLQQTRSPDRAAVLLRADLRRRLGERLGLPVGTSPEVLAATVEARTGIAQDEVLPVVADFSCSTDAELLALTARVDELRREVLGGR
jgi:hypothetical protein